MQHRSLDLGVSWLDNHFCEGLRWWWAIWYTPE